MQYYCNITTVWYCNVSAIKLQDEWVKVELKNMPHPLYFEKKLFGTGEIYWTSEEGKKQRPLSQKVGNNLVEIHFFLFLQKIDK